MVSASPTKRTKTWTEVKKHVLANYGKFEYVFFISPINGKEACIMPMKYTYDKLRKMKVSEYNRITAY